MENGNHVSGGVPDALLCVIRMGTDARVLFTFHLSSFTSHLGLVHPLQDVALHQCLPLSSVCCFLFQVVLTFPVMSSCQLVLGRPLDLFPLLGCHSVQRLVHLLSFILAI